MSEHTDVQDNWLQWLHSLVESMPTPAMVFTTPPRLDPKLPLKGANEALARVLGRSLDELRGLTIPDISDPEDAARDAALFLDLLAQKRTQYTIEKRFLHASGAFFPCFLTVWKVHHADDRVTCMATVTDISDVKKLEEAKRSSEHFVSATPDHISFLGLDYRYVAINDSYLRAHEMTREEIVGHTIAELLGSDTFNDLIKSNIDRCFNGEAINYEAWFNFPAENRRCMTVTYVPSRDTDGKIVGALVSSRDITEIRNLQTDLARFQKLEAIGRLSCTVAHDFNNLLMVISGATELARVGASKGKVVVRRMYLARGVRSDRECANSRLVQSHPSAPTQSVISTELRRVGSSSRKASSLGM